METALAKTTVEATDHIRWLKYTQRGLSMAEIALQEASTEEEVKAAIQRYDNRRLALTREEMEADQLAILHENSELRKLALQSALTARRIEVSRDQMGYETRVDLGPDHDVQLRAVETEISLIAALMPKGGIKVGVAVQNNGHGGVSTGVSMDDGFENRLRSIIEKRKALGPAPAGQDAPNIFVDGRPIDAEFIDDNEDEDGDDDEGEEGEEGE